MLTKRALIGGLALGLSRPSQAHAFLDLLFPPRPEPVLEAVPEGDQVPDWFSGEIPDEPFNIPKVNMALVDPELHRQLVDYTGPEAPGTIVVSTGERFLYLVREEGLAIRYGIGVGRMGFNWSGAATVGRKAKWPGWVPPPEMLKRRPDLPRYVAPGLENPLGCRALYLYQGTRDTIYRIHGTNEPWSIGGAESSGCIRLLNEDILDLFNRTPVGTAVVVKPPAAGIG